MKNSEFLTFKTFPNKETAESFAEVLRQRNIAYEIEEDALVFDVSYANNPLQKEYLLKLKATDFTLANEVFEAYFSSLLSDVDPDYYLFSFSTAELEEIVAKPDEWGSFDYLLAQQLLKERGLPFSEEEVAALKAKRLQELAIPETETVSNIFGYYVVSILFFPVGLVIGWIWAASKKNLPNGDRVYAYNSTVRRHGRIIFTAATLIMMWLLCTKVFQLLPEQD